MLLTQTGHGQVGAQPLKFFKNYFVTGDYAVAGVGMDLAGTNGLVSGVVNISGVPDGSEALAAFLYWQVVSPTGADSGSLTAKFNHQLLSTPASLPTPTEGPFAVVGNPLGTESCPLTGGGPGNRVYAYRADVLRFLDVVNGRHRINGNYTVELPDGGNSLQMPRAIGASLVVIYRSPDMAAPLNAIVIYDGNYTKQASQTMTQTIKGFYDPAPVAGKITHIAGSAQSLLSERLRVPGSVVDNGFRSAQGPSWDNLTLVTANPAASSFVTSVEPRGLISDCLTWGAIVYRTQVNDSDGDGLLNTWESSASTLYDPNGEALPNLAAMGASAVHKDVFVEVGSMYTSGVATYGAPAPGGIGAVVKPAHTHLPTHAALKKLGDTFLSAPVSNPDGVSGIDVHFDLGDAFPTGVADPYIVHGPGSRGGESIDELATVCPRVADAPWVCQFSDYPGTVGWKSGLRYFKDMPLSLSDDACETAEEDGNPATICERVFDRGRKDMFRYVLFAHALGVPKADCLVNGFPDLTCQDSNPLFHVPVTNTGAGDFPGGDAIVTLGGFNDAGGLPVGTDYMQAATLMHELGHTFQLRHGGALDEPNCKPNYLSVMNYLFQLRGLLKNDGRSYLDFSGQRLSAIDENTLASPGLGFDLNPPGAAPPYRTGWYAPQGPGTIGSPATRHCDGTPLVAGEPPMVRVDTESLGETIDGINWNKSDDPQTAQDIDFDGFIGPLNTGTNDWAIIRLNQLGSRRNVGGWYWVLDAGTGTYVAFMGPLSLDAGRGDLGRGDLGRGDLGRGDLGRGDLGRGDLGRGDLGRGDLGRGDLGRGDLGRGDLGRGDLGRGDLGRGDLGDSVDGEANVELLEASGFTPPSDFHAFVRGTDGMGTNSSVPEGWRPNGEPDTCDTLTPADCHRIRLDWNPPNAGTATGYFVYRIVDIGPAELIATLGPAQLTWIDPQELPNGLPLTYKVTSTFLVEGVTKEGTPASATVTSVNWAPSATAQSVTAWEDIPIGITLAATDVDSATLTFSIVTSPSHGSLTGAPPSVMYGPTLNYNSTDGTESFTFKAHESSTWNNLGQDSLPASIDVTVTPVNDAPSFLKGANQSVTQPAGAQSVANWATSIKRGPLNTTNEDGQTVDFVVTNDSNALFSAQPAIAPDGTLTYTPASNAAGVATVTVRIHDNGGVDPAHGGTDTSGPEIFTITVIKPPYTFVNVYNLPPASGVTFKPNSKGTLISFEFEMKKNGTRVDISGARPRIVITGPTGWTAKTYTPGCNSATVTACSSFLYETSHKAWDLQWKPVNAPVGTYYVIVWIDETGQRFPETGNGFPVVFKK
ncbi:MAG: Ig-like domain-containing protein [Vicinamibacterales bacterium]